MIALAVCGLALILILVRFPGARFFAGRSDAWNSQAIESTLAAVRVREVDPAHAAVVFSFDLENKTDSDYRLSAGPNIVIMSRLRGNGSLSSDQQVSLDSAAFVPARDRTRISLEVNHPFNWPAQRDAAADHEVRQFVSDEVAGLRGFVLFDQATRYQIELTTVSPELQQSAVITSRN